MASRYLLMIPLSLFTLSSGFVLSATVYYYKIRRIVHDKRPFWIMGVGYFLASLIIAVDIAIQISNGDIAVWHFVAYVVVGTVGLVASAIVIRFEAAELRRLEQEDTPEQTLKLNAIRAKIESRAHADHGATK